ncbi:MAG TPA: hypothetical protein VNI82_00395 [Candidatus Nitrosotenuis sp.]|nr:hypothetical protein [Candidatus Nitrosotenuis sp.]
MHRGTVSSLALIQPATHSSGIKCCGGLPYGINIDTGEVELIDPYRWKAHGHIGAPIALTLAKINGGKTSLAKKLAITTGQLKSGKGRVRVGLDDHRRNSGELEYAQFAHYARATPLSLSSNPINILDPKMKMSVSANMRMLINTQQYLRSMQLDPESVMYLQVALNMMHDLYSNDMSLELLQLFLRTQEVGDVDIYIDRHRKRILEQLRLSKIERQIYNPEESLWKVDLEARLKSRGSRSDIDPRAHKKAVLDLIYTFERLLPGGDFGGTFGGTYSLANHMRQRVVSFDYTGLNPNSVGLVQAIMWQWKGAAHERADTDLAFQCEVHDENHKLWQNIEYARAMSAYMKLIRSTSAFLILNSHRSGDYEAIAGDQGLLAQNALNEAEVLFLGGQPPNVARAIGQRFDLPRKVTDRLSTLDTGEFCLKVGDRFPIFVRLRLTPRELQICESNQANYKMLEG